jgi:alkylation response protein AidB-like acyl-CoA dehydrogenase
VTAVRPASSEAETVLQGAARLAPMIAARAADIERGRRLPADVREQLTALGCFRLALPASHGGAGADLPCLLRVFEALSRADASVGWTVMIGSCAWCDVAGLPGATFDALYADGPDVVIGGAFAPTGVAVAVEGGFRVRGRWAFASGCEDADWLYGNCAEATGDGHRLRTVLFAPAEVTIEDTWDVVGMRGTGSHHFRAEDVVVPPERTALVFVDEPSLDTPIVRIPPPQLYALGIAGVAIGAAQGALDEISALAAEKVPLLAATTLAGSGLFQFQLATADTELRAARALVHDHAAEAWATAALGLPFAPEQRARLRAAAAWATGRAAAAVGVAYRAGGSHALHTDHPLQRRLRDIHTIGQHFLVRPDTLTTAGAVLTGQEVDLTVF